MPSGSQSCCCACSITCVGELLRMLTIPFFGAMADCRHCGWPSRRRKELWDRSDPGGPHRARPTGVNTADTLADIE